MDNNININNNNNINININNNNNLFLKIFRNIIIKNALFNQLRIINNNYKQQSLTLQQLKNYKGDKQSLRSIHLNISNDDYELGGDKYSLDTILKNTNIECLEFSNSFSPNNFDKDLGVILPIHSLTSLIFSSHFRYYLLEESIGFHKLINLKKLKFKKDSSIITNYYYHNNNDDDYYYDSIESQLKSSTITTTVETTLPPIKLPNNLEYFKLSDFPNKISKDSFQFPKSLKTLRLSNTRIKDFEMISELPNLETLSIGRECIKRGDIKKLPQSLTTLKLLIPDLLFYLGNDIGKEILSNSNLLKLKIGNSKSNRLFNIEFHNINIHNKNNNNNNNLTSNDKENHFSSWFPSSLKEIQFSDYHGLESSIPSLNNLFSLFGYHNEYEIDNNNDNNNNNKNNNNFIDYKPLIKSIHFYNSLQSSKNIDCLNKFINLESLSFEDWNGTINKGTLPKSLKKLVLPHSYTNALDEGVLPKGLIHLEIGSKFNDQSFTYALEGLNQLEVLKFKSSSLFNQRIYSIPKSIKVLHFGEMFNQRLESIIKDCVNLKSLKLGQFFSHNLTRDILPLKGEGIVELELTIRDFHDQIPLSQLPLTKLKCARYFNRVFEIGSLPFIGGTLKSIEFFDDYTQQLLEYALPSSIESIVFHKSYFKEFTNACLPNSLISISFESGCPKLDNLSFPKSFTRILTSRHNRKFIDNIYTNHKHLSHLLRLY
ncbi:hypothetical protein ACTFIU_005193 [Dictyostelium citrinum]